MLIDLFINAGWYTVPLKGELKRLESGKKSLPIFETEWRKKYSEQFNKERVKLGGVITGALSGIIAIDCDNQLTYDLFKTFDPDYKFHFISKGKEHGGGTIIYSYTSEIGNFKLNTPEIQLDFYADDGFVYLPLEENYTKESWIGITELPQLKEAPSAILALLKTFKSKVPDNTPRKDNSVKHTISNRLAPMIDKFLQAKKYDPMLFKVLTPYSFRDLPSYVTKGHLHPNDVPKGRGSEYLSKVSAILGSDISINIEMYTNTMLLINSFWDDPMERGKLMSTIINPMIEERSMINGNVIWQYDPYWEKMGFIATATNGDYFESFYDDVKGLYYLINYTVPYVRTFSDKRPIITTLKTLLGRGVTETQYDTTKQLIRTTLNPSLEFGHIEGHDTFNLFRQTPELAVINNPEPYKNQYNRPTHIINFFESLIPDDFMRRFVLSFIKTKLTTFNYSPIILYFIGKPGSGKDTFVTILRRILGQEYVAKPDTKVFMEQYNGWMIDKYFIQLDEYGNKLTRSSEKQEVLGKLKAYTGSPELQIRAMRSDGYNYHHCTTFIMTANRNPLPIETDDRRVAFIKTPNKLQEQHWVQEAGGITHVQEMIKNEIMDFCYYLATEVETLKMDSYVIAPETEDKEKLILDSLPAAEQLVYFIVNERFEELAELAEEYGVADFKLNWEKNKLEEEKLSQLYDMMTEGNGSYRVVVKMLKGSGLNRSHTTRNGMNQFYYFVPNLHKAKNVNPEFKPIDNATKVKPEGI